MNNQLEQSFKDKVLDEIKAGHIQMRPRWHFVLRASLMALASVILAVLILFLASFVVFYLHYTGSWFAPALGWAGWKLFLLSVPWVLVVLILVFFIILEFLVRHYPFAYRRPLLFSAIGIVAVAFLGAAVVVRTPLHGRLFMFAEQGRLPVAGHFYRRFGHPPFEHLHQGMIIASTPGGFIMEEVRGGRLSVVVGSHARIMPRTALRVGDRVVVLGVGNNGVVQADGIRVISPRP